MGHRLSKIVTRTGDAGETGLATGARIAKTHPRVTAMGDIDELKKKLAEGGQRLVQRPHDRLVLAGVAAVALASVAAPCAMGAATAAIVRMMAMAITGGLYFWAGLHYLLAARNYAADLASTRSAAQE